MKTAIKKGQELTVTIEGLAFGGKGFTKINDFIIFIERALPGQKALVRIFKKKENYAEARLLEVIQPAPHQKDSQCPHFSIDGCGGCLWQNFEYGQQLVHKQQQVEECIQHIGGFKDFQVEPIIGSPDVYFYRNKMEYSFNNRPWYPNREDVPENPPPIALGLHVPKRFNQIIDIHDCQLLSLQTNQILKYVKSFALQSDVPAYNQKFYTGFWRHLVFREAKNSGQLMVNIVTSGDKKYFKTVRQLGEELLKEFPQITTLLHTVNRKRSDTAVGDEEKILHGTGRIIERLGELEFSISASSFFQTNSRQAEYLYNKAIEFADLHGSETVYDLYCGTGTISLYLARAAKHVIGFELVPEAIKDADLNKQVNQIENCEFFEGDLKNVLAGKLNEEASSLPLPDVLITDPPRVGMHAQVVAQILQIRPSKIVYVSCNPSTLARDLKMLCESTYELRKVQPVDMFPHTAHCEAVALLERKQQEK